MGTILANSLVLPSNQSATPLRSVILTNPTASPFSLACFMYSATGASRSSHAKYTASRAKKSVGLEDGSLDVAPGLRSLVGVDFGNETEDENTM